MVTTAVSSPCSDRILPAIASTGIGSPVTRIDQADLADAALVGADQHAGDERREMRVVGLHPALLDLARAAAGTVNSRSAGSFISDVAPPASVTTIGIGHRVDDQVQAVALGARLRLGDAQLAGSSPRSPRWRGAGR